MALPSTVYKARLQVADMDRHYYADHALTIARHPSETDERMMVRVLAYALHASDTLAFGRGLSAENEPDLHETDLTGAIRKWIDVGLPDEKTVRKASGRAEQVFVYAYGRAADVWWDGNRKGLQRLDALTVVQLAPDTTRALADMAERTMQLQCNIQDGDIWLNNGELNVEILRTTLCAPRVVVPH